MNESTLTAYLSEFIDPEFAIISFSEIVPDPPYKTGRNEYLAKYQNRLSRLKELHAPESVIEEAQQTALVLDSLREDEQIFFWQAKKEAEEYSGLCSSLGIVCIYGQKLNNV